MELRYGTTSAISCTQYKQELAFAPGGGVPADAFMDRIVHNAIWVHMGETNKRQRLELNIKKP